MFKECVVYDNLLLLIFYFVFSLFKIYYQTFFSPPSQIVFLTLANALLAYPFFKPKFYSSRINVVFYFFLITLGESAIILYNIPIFLEFGMVFYLLSKIALIPVFRNTLKDFRLSNVSDFIKILGPQLASFTIGYLIYNDSNLDISVAFLVIIDAVVHALLFSYIFYFKNYTGVNHIKAGMLFLFVHDAFGGFNIFNNNIDKNFVISFCLITIGNFLLGQGLWKSRAEYY
jgi:hypothetical protein